MKTKLPILLLACLCGCEAKVHIESRPVEWTTNEHYALARSREGHAQLNHDPQFPAPGYTVVCDQHGHFAPARNGYPLLASGTVTTNYQEAVRETWRYRQIEDNPTPTKFHDSIWTECK